MIRIEGTVESVHRLRNDRDGNPKHRLQLDSGRVYTTEPGTQVAYSIGEDLVGRKVSLSINGSGNIAGLEESDG